MALHTEKSNNEKKVVLSESTYRKISRILLELSNRLQADLCVFADINGYPVDYEGNIDNMDVSSLTAVAAGAFSASREMAKLISGEHYFRNVFHEGEKRNMYICNVGAEFLLIVVFDKKTSIGLVRLLTHHTVTRLSDHLMVLKQGNKKVSEFLDSEFRTLLDKELDKAFGLS